MKFKGKKYISVPLEKINSEKELNVDVYVHLPLNLRMLKIVKFDQIFDKDRVHLYKNKGLKEFFIINPMAHPEECPNIPKEDPLAADIPPEIKEAIKAKIENPNPNEDDKDAYYDSPVLKALKEAEKLEEEKRKKENSPESLSADKSNKDKAEIGSLDDDKNEKINSSVEDETEENKKLNKNYENEEKIKVKGSSGSEDETENKIEPDSENTEESKFSKDPLSEDEKIKNKKLKDLTSEEELKFGKENEDDDSTKINKNKHDANPEDEINLGKDSSENKDEESFNFSPQKDSKEEEQSFSNDPENNNEAIKVDSALLEGENNDSHFGGSGVSKLEEQRFKSSQTSADEIQKISGSSAEEDKSLSKFSSASKEEKNNFSSGKKLKENIGMSSQNEKNADDNENSFSNDPLYTDKKTLVKGTNEAEDNEEEIVLKGKKNNPFDPKNKTISTGTDKNKKNDLENELSNESQNKDKSNKNSLGKSKNAKNIDGDDLIGKEDGDDSNKLIGKTRKFKNESDILEDELEINAENENLDNSEFSFSSKDLNDSLTMEKKLAEELIKIDSQLPSEVSNQAITKISKEAEELSVKFGAKIAKKMSALKADEKFTFNDGERLAIEKIAILDSELQDIGQSGKDLLIKIQSNPEAVTPEEMKEYVFLAKFAQQKSETAKTLVSKLNQLRDEYCVLGADDFDKKEEIYNKITKIQDKLAKVAAMDPSSKKELAEIGMEENIQPPKWFEKEASDEPMQKQMDRIVNNMQKVAQEADSFAKAVVTSQNKFVAKREEDLAESEIKQMAKKTRLSPESIYLGSKATTLALAYGYSEAQFLEDIARIAIFEIDPNVKSFQKVPEEIISLSNIVNSKDAIPFLAVRDMQKIIAIIRVLAGIPHLQQLSFNFTARDILAVMDLLRKEPKNIDILYLEQARQFLQNGLSSDEIKISRDTAMTATREISKWV